METKDNEPVEITSSLSSPADRGKYRLNPKVPPLNYEQTQNAVKDLFEATPPYLPTERAYKDPQYSNQNFCLVSFLPAKGAQPDKDGFFGFLKVRGVFPTTEDASKRAEWIIQNHDSYHRIYTAHIGAPFPMCADGHRHSKDDFEVEVKHATEKTFKEAMREKDENDRKEREDIKDREAKLLEETDEDFKMDPIDQYTQTQVKRAQLIWTYKETAGKLPALRNSIRKACKELEELDKEYPDFYNQHYERYMESRRKVGLTDEKVEEQGSFIKYLAGDVDLDFDPMTQPEEVPEGSYGQVGTPLKPQ